MDVRREVDAVNEASLNRELQSLMAVKPSPEFLARVRVRVAREPLPNGWRMSWMFAIAGAAAIVIVGVMAWPPSESVMEPPKPLLQAQRQQPAAAAPIEAADRALLLPVESRVPRVSRPIPAAPADRAIDIDLPQVVIGENEVRAYTALVASVRERRFNAAVPGAPDLNAPLDVKELSPVEPLEIEPIVRLAAVQAEGERP